MAEKGDSYREMEEGQILYNNFLAGCYFMNMFLIFVQIFMSLLSSSNWYHLIFLSSFFLQVSKFEPMFYFNTYKYGQMKPPFGLFMK